MKISLLGPTGTFSEIVAKQFYPEAFFIQTEEIYNVLGILKSNKADYAFIPFKSSSCGFFSTTLSLINDFKFYIHEEKTFKTQLCLAGYMELCEAKRLYAYPPSYKQCKLTLKKYNFKGDLVLTKNNAESAQLAQKDDQSVAITSKEASEHYNLALIAEGVQDSKNNKTQYVLLSKNQPKIDLPRKDFYYFTAPEDYTAAHEMLKKVLKESFSLDTFASDESSSNHYLISIDLINKTHLVKLESVFPRLRYFGSYKL